ncbi:hypothetical protein ElyMa_005791200 [Elysia marginata]|uniref:Uncharacterized protein n=1 Tax=Elysia marginata TaxID=1093978 RepID=A0AAV4FTD5_9GAST|nr:hypothetical protein ElyMa_005791200 [Elysia marginata]
MAAAKDEKIITLSPDFCADLNTTCFAAVVKIKDVFCEANKEALSKGMCTLSSFDDRIMLMPLNLIKPFVQETTLFYKSFLGTYADRLCPVAVCVSKRSLGPEFDLVYDEPGASKQLSGMIDSLSKHLDKMSVSVKRNEAKPVRDDVRCVEDSLEDDEMMVVFQSIVNIIHMASNDDYRLVFAESSTDTSGSSWVIGEAALNVPVKTLHATKNESDIEYDPEAKTGVPLRLSSAVCREFQFFFRCSFGFWKGDSGKPEQKNGCSEFDGGNAFEKQIVQSMASKNIVKGPGAASIISMIIVFASNLHTYQDRPSPVTVLECDKESIWTMLCTSLLGLHSASTVNHITTKMGKKTLQYHTLSRNFLINLYHTSTRGSLTVCGLVLHLCKKLREGRTTSNIGNNYVRSSRKCPLGCGDFCAKVWVASFVGPQAIQSNVAASKEGAHDSPGCGKYHRMFVSEFNTDCSLLGSVGVKASDVDSKYEKPKKVAPGFIAAHKALMASTPQQLDIGDTDVQSVTDVIESALKSVQSGVDEYSEYVMVRSECTDAKLETVLTTNSAGGMNASGLGFLFMPIVRGDIISSLSKNLFLFELKASKITDKPTESYGSIMGAISGNNLACYWKTIDASDHTVSSISVLRVEGAKGVKDINTNPEINKLDNEHASIYTKVSTKIKCFNGLLLDKQDFDTGGGDAFGGMNVKRGGSGGVGHKTVSKSGHSKVDVLKSALVNVAVNGVLVSKKKRLIIRANHDAIAALSGSRLMDPMFVFNTSSLQLVKTWDDLRSVFITGALMIKYGFLPRDEFKLPVYVELDKKYTIDCKPFPHRFLTGSTLNYCAVQHGTFYSELQKKHFVTEKNAPLEQTAILGGFSGNVNISAPVTLAFIRLSGAGYEQPKTDELMPLFKNVLGMTDVEICQLIYSNATKIIDKIKKQFIINEDGGDDDDDVVISATEVIGLFRNYQCDLVFDGNETLINMAENIQNTDVMKDILARIKATEREEEDDEEETVGKPRKRKRVDDDDKPRMAKYVSPSPPSSSSSSSSDGGDAGDGGGGDDDDNEDKTAKKIRLACEGFDDV